MPHRADTSPSCARTPLRLFTPPRAAAYPVAPDVAPRVADADAGVGPDAPDALSPAAAVDAALEVAGVADVTGVADVAEVVDVAGVAGVPEMVEQGGDVVRLPADPVASEESAAAAAEEAAPDGGAEEPAADSVAEESAPSLTAPPTVYPWDDPGAGQDDTHALAEMEPVSDEAGAAADDEPEVEHGGGEVWTTLHHDAREEMAPPPHHEDSAADDAEVDDADDWFAEEHRSARSLVAADDEDDWFRQTDDDAMTVQRVASTSPAAGSTTFYGLDDLERLSRASGANEAPSGTTAAGAGVSAWGTTDRLGPHAPDTDGTTDGSTDAGAGMVPDGATESAPGESSSSPSHTALGTWSNTDDPRATVAEALERVAVRIRDGHVSLPSDLPSPSEEAALAAVLSALLQARTR